MKPWQAALNETPSQRERNESTKREREREREDPKSKLVKANPKWDTKGGGGKEIMSSLFELFLLLVQTQLMFLPKWCHVGFSLDLPLFGLGHSPKGHGSNLWFSANRIALFDRTLDLWTLI